MAARVGARVEHDAGMIGLTGDQRQLLDRQLGVATAAQLIDWGFDHATMSRRARAGRWQRLHQGVYVLHSGPVDWRTRASAALLMAGPGAALSHRSAGFVQRIVASAPQRIEISVPVDRTPPRASGVKVFRRATMPFVLRSGLPRTHPAETVLDLLASARDADAAVGFLTQGVRAGASPHEILAYAALRSRLRHRGLVEEILGAQDATIESPLEHRYHRDVERAHGLPRSQTQVRQIVGGRAIRADAIYPGLRTRIELDGRLAHPGGRTDQDTWRDNAVLLERGEITLRYRWSHVAMTPCRTAAQVLHALRSCGYRDPARPCSPTCPILSGS